jgi:hypothetical protein
MMRSGQVLDIYVEPIGFADGLNMGYERKESKMTTRFLNN